MQSNFIVKKQKWTKLQREKEKYTQIGETLTYFCLVFERLCRQEISSV